jgi:hypothetical protein
LQTIPPVDLKTTFYLSEKHPDKMINEGISTMFNELDGVKNELRAMMKPNGSLQAPARSCYDLFLCNPSFEEGQWVGILKDWELPVTAVDTRARG